MPVIDNPFFQSVDEMFDGREGVVYSLDGVRNHIRKHQVRVKAPYGKYLSANEVALCPGLPKPGSLWLVHGPNGELLGYDLLAMLIKQSARPKVEGDWQLWEVTSEYSTNLTGFGPGGTRLPDGPNAAAAAANDPTQELANVEWDFETIREAEWRDINGWPFQTTALKPFASGLETEIDCPTLTVSRNEINFNFIKAALYARALNSKTFLGAPKGAVQLLPLRATQQNRGIFRYWRVTYKLRFRPPQKTSDLDFSRPSWVLPQGNYIVYGPGGPAEEDYEEIEDGFVDDTWNRPILNQGYHKFNQITGAVEEIVNPKLPNRTISSPVPLDNFGQPMFDAEVANKWYLIWQRYRYINIQHLLVAGVG